MSGLCTNRVAASAIAVALSIFAVSANAQSMSAGFDAFQRGDYAAALAQFRPLAKQGDAAAQTTLGLMYENGYGVEHSPVRAQMWWHIGATNGDAYAEELLKENAEELTTDEKTDAERMAKDWLSEHQK